MGSLEQECNQKRNDILGYAFRLADEGAHYLWGANGDKPTKDGNVEYADVVLDPDKPEKSSFCAASIVVGGITYVCAGRFRHGDLASTPPINKIVVTANAPVNKDSAPLKEVLAFIEKNRNNKAAQIGWGFDLTPRVVKGDSIKDYSTGTDVTNAVVWGEGCDDTLHFDCGGFVRHVVKKVCSVPIDGISANPGQKNILGEVMATEVNRRRTGVTGRYPRICWSHRLRDGSASGELQ